MSYLAILPVAVAMCALAAEPAKAPADPRITSVHPTAIRAGELAMVTLRGVGLAGARALVFEDGNAVARVVKQEQEDGSDLVRVELSTVQPSKLRLRLLAARGVSNELPLHVVPEPTVDEPSSELTQLPVVVTGRLMAKGESDTIWLQAKRGEVFTFTAVGSAGFDPSLMLAEPSGSWFDESRLNRIAFNDEPLHFPGLSQDARLVHRFEKDGKYALQVRAFSGTGGPDFGYWLRIAKGVGETPSLHPVGAPLWDERRFTRRLGTEWMPSVAARGKGEAVAAPALVQGAVDGARMTIPGLVEGRITKPAEVHRIKVPLEKPGDYAIEVETPEATMPRFNPVVRLLAPEGGEMVTNVYTKRNNNGLYMMKMIQAKSTVTLRTPGEYTLEIRDITTDVAGDDFTYRVLVRPQIPHAGKVDVAEDRINLEPGQSKPVTLNLEREENFAGLVLVSAEGLPAGVTAMAGMANPIERPPLPNGGRVERYTAKPQTSTLILTAAEDALPSELPAKVRVLVRTIVDGRQSAPMRVKEVPVMVIPRRPS